jgi:hypothetical protein
LVETKAQMNPAVTFGADVRKLIAVRRREIV